MADPVNNFGPITPEQEAMIRRQAVQPALGPFDISPLGLGKAAGGAALGYGTNVLGRMLSGVSAQEMPMLLRLLTGGGMAATGAAMGNLADPMNPALARPDPRDAEGQPGGFYGKSREQIVRELMK
jgi:hypothetical protein